MAQLLLAEDDAAIRGALIRALTERGHAVTSQPSAMTALQHVLDSPPDLILALHAGQVVARRDLLTHVWRMPYGGADKTVDVHVSWLRRKLGETAQHPRAHPGGRRPRHPAHPAGRGAARGW